MSVRSLRAAVRRTPVLVATAALSATVVLAGCSEDTAGDVEETVEEEVGDTATVG